MPSSSYRASSIAPDALQWLSGTKAARVLGLFEHACNLMNEHGEVVAIVAPVVGDGPFNIVLDQLLPLNKLLDTDSPVSVSPHAISLGAAVFDMRRASPWSAAPDWRRLRSARSHIAAQLSSLQDWIRARSPAGSMLEFEHVGSNAHIAGYRQPWRQPDAQAGVAFRSLLAMKSAADQLPAAINAADLPACQSAARRLAGCGAGLTPAGDDYLLGAMHAAWILHAAETAAAISRSLVSAAIPLTTSLSNAWLAAAGRGEAAAVWHSIFDALCKSDSSELQVALQRLLATGHTSGADSLAGFARTLLHWAGPERAS